MWWMTYPSGFTLFCAPNDDEGMQSAKDYIAEHDMTAETVKLAKRSTDSYNVVVVVKK